MKPTESTVFSRKAITIATFWGGLLVAGVLMYKNFKTFGNPKYAQRALFICILVNTLIISLSMCLPDSVNDTISGISISGLYVLVISLVLNKYQTEDISSFVASGGKLASGWIAVGYVFLSMLVNVSFIYIITLLSVSNVVELPGYPKSMSLGNEVTLYADNNVTDEYLTQLGDVINASGYVDEAHNADLLLSKEYKFYMLKFVIEKQMLAKDSDVIVAYNFLEYYINNNLSWDKDMKVAFTDPDLKKLYPLDKVEVIDILYANLFNGLEHYVLNKKHHLYYSPEISMDVVKDVQHSVKTLHAYFPENMPLNIFLINSSNQYTVKFFVERQLWNNRAIHNRFKASIDHFGLKKKARLVYIDPDTLEEYVF